MGKLSPKEAILQLLKDVDVKKPANERLMTNLLEKLAQSRPAETAREWTPTDAADLQLRINKKPALERFSKNIGAETPANYQVREMAKAPLVEGLMKSGGGGWQFHPTETIGPIYKEDGSFGYFEFLKLQRSIQVHYNNNPEALIYATVSTPINIVTKPTRRTDLGGIERKTAPKTGFEIGKRIKIGDLENILVGGIITSIGSAYTLSKGTIWLRASLFRPGTLANEYIGFRISKGTLAFPVPTSIAQDKISIAAGIKFSLSLTLDHSAAVDPSTAPYGADARAASVGLPSVIQLQFSQSGFLEIETDESASLRIYDTQYNFSPGSGAVGKRSGDSNDYYTALDFARDPVFEIKKNVSPFFHIQGRAGIQRAYWMLISRIIQPGQPTVLEGNGAIGLQLYAGLLASWKGVEDEARFTKLMKPFLLVTSGGFQINDEECQFYQQREIYPLWQTDNKKDNLLTLSFAQKKKLAYVSFTKDAEGLLALADADFNIDKPFQADGSRISPAMEDCMYIKIAATGHADMQLFWPVIADKNNAVDFFKDLHQFAIKNAFFSTTKPMALFMKGGYDDRNRITEGDLRFTFGLLNLEPMLPHPYAFNNAWSKFKRKGDERIPRLAGAIQCTCGWNLAENPEVNIDFKLPAATQNLMAGWFKPGESLTKAYQQKGSKTNGGDMTAQYPNIKAMCTLLDVSTGYDHLGVSVMGQQGTRLAATVSVESDNEVSISRMFLQAPVQQLAGVTLPHVTWEPYFNLTGPEVSGNAQDPDVGLYSFNSAAEPSMFFQSGAEAVNIDPLAFMRHFKEELRPTETRVIAEGNLVRKEKHSGVFFSLPHGKLAMAYLTPYNAQQATFHARQYDFIQPRFDHGSIAGAKAKGGWQFRIAANFQNNFLPPYQNGWAFQLSNVNDDQSPLGITPHGFFQKVFFQNADAPTRGVPITHLDFSGYGASTFSNWVNPEARYATVAQAKFDMLRGRVAHEIIQVVSVIYPWGIAVTRTISFYKRNNAILYREDSGWIAKSDGLFDFSNKENNVAIDNPYEIHPGHIHGLYNIRNIKEISSEVDDLGTGPVTGTIAVSFDADVDIEHISSAKTNGLVPGWGFKGYLQLSPQDKPIAPEKLKTLFDRKQNTIGGNVDCIMQLAGGKQVMLVKRVDMSMNSNGVLVAAARGSVQLPPDGSWSVVQINKQTNEVSPIANKLSTPVYKKGIRRRNSPAFIIDAPDKNSHITSPDALFDNNASPQYGYVQNTGTQKLIFPNPFYDKNIANQLLSDATKLADSFTLMNSKGIFPNIDKAINAEAVVTSITEIVDNGLKKQINKVVNDRGMFDIVGESGDPFRIYAEYKAGSKDTILEYITNSDSVEDAWKNQLDNLSVHVDMGPFQPIMTISGNFNAGNGVKAEIGTGENAPQLKLPGALDKIYKVIEFLDSLDFNDLGNNADAVKKGLQVFMSNGAEAWEYKFKAEKEIPMVKFPFDPINYNSPTTPLKLDAFFKMGCYFNMPIKIPNTIDQLTPSIGAFLELKADIRVMCVSLAAATIYAKGSAVVGLAADLNNPPTLYFKFGFGVELCVGLPVIGSVSLTYLAGIDMSINSKVFTVGAFLYFRGRVELAFGLVEVAISIEAAGKIEKPDGQPCSVIASVTFSLEISVAFVIDLDFTETWTEQRQIA
ncbi:MAG: hypothetical protein EOO14_01255 [Chitinophagaceae bacterium]|nr:MAG: hypothetical protein EOO14_01255 [Chitinophagaceae bacterium]